MNELTVQDPEHAVRILQWITSDKPHETERMDLVLYQIAYDTLGIWWVVHMPVKENGMPYISPRLKEDMLLAGKCMTTGAIAQLMCVSQACADHLYEVPK